MMSKKPIITTLLLILLLITACGAPEAPTLTVPEGAQAGDLVDPEPCTYEAKEVEYTADCGTLIVPENRIDPNSRLIALPVTRIRATGSNPAEPIFRLGGGPGQSNMGFSHLERLIEKHDLVLVGYRGVDSSPELQCPEFIQAAKGGDDDLLSEESIANMGEALAHCAARLQDEGVDLDGYTILEEIEDVETARVGLGYERINLLSESFGTRVAIIYAWEHPDSLYRSAMISVNPPGRLAWEPDVLDWQITYDADLCAREPECSAQTDDLAETMRTVSQNMPSRWLFLPIDAGKVRFFTHFFLWYREGLTGQDAAMVYDAYLAAEKGDPSGLAMMSLMYDLIKPATMMTWGQSAAIVMSTDFDPARDYFAEMNPPGSILGAPQSEIAWSPLYFSDWPATLIPAEYRQVQASDVETLLVSGSVDSTTPARYATEELLPSLGNGQQVILSEFGHVADVWDLQPEATMHLLTTFYDTGVADDSLFTYQPMNFDVGMGFPAMAKLVLAAIVLLIALVWLIIYLVRRRRARNA
ncbi:MAG: alpha/beta fold hydrolase [Anaerolineales bacterium]|jgi:pimeloyl-ACP methyl ester carboxylesterase